MNRRHRWPFGAVRAGGLFRGRAADLTGKVVIITGASSGIGRAAAHAFAREGACVVLVARRAERLRAVADQLAEMGAAAWVMPADVTCDHDLEALVEHALGACGRIDILVNNAGLAFGGGHHALEPARLRRLVDTNVYGPLRLAQLVLPVMLRQGSGHIVNVSSMGGVIAPPGQAAYAATRTALISFSRALQRETAGTGVRVSVVMPTFVNTPMTRGVSEAAVKASGALASIERFDPPLAPAAAIVNAVRFDRREVLMGGLQLRLGAAVERIAPRLVDWFWRARVDTPAYIETVSRLGEDT